MSRPAESASLAGRCILITGAGGGLGGVAARACAERGAQLVLLDRVVSKLETLSDELVSHGHRQPALYPLDLAKAGDADHAELADILLGQFGGLHGILHCAAAPGNLGPLADLTQAGLEHLLRVNLSAAHGLTRALLPLLRQTGDAAVVFTSDASARRGQAYWGGYGLAKIALEALARMLAQELEGEGRVRAHLLIPGAIDSPIRRHTHPGEHPEQRRRPDDLAETLASLLGSATTAPKEWLIDRS
ncbi:SDR family NAD(P)-dependent oxidoreductase [Methylococcus sp. EFPC2]|uniref:SDR family NAD(P)-dependent oxidoreductase n=1 Tax=Methylococcus sp. EFPC2 TaxID=2812648 RepID=UPI0019681490|nr:SDR family NAD(P)-dependent oxidoreductase [Methylococcus sp. EFPC2]QSA97622.1 SDR family NAD(P)-dependent oxidoreductase [Methylococcus sp. EFPC2]